MGSPPHMCKEQEQESWYNIKCDKFQFFNIFRILSLIYRLDIISISWFFVHFFMHTEFAHSLSLSFVFFFEQIIKTIMFTQRYPFPSMSQYSARVSLPWCQYPTVASCHLFSISSPTPAPLLLHSFAIFQNLFNGHDYYRRRYPHGICYWHGSTSISSISVRSFSVKTFPTVHKPTMA